MSVRKRLQALENAARGESGEGEITEAERRRLRSALARFPTMTDEELLEIRDAGPPVNWGQLSESELREIEAGERKPPMPPV